MIKHVEHIGIAVRDRKAAQALFDRLLGAVPYKVEEVGREGVVTVFYQSGESKIELLESTRDGSPVHRFLEKRGEGIHHIAFEVDDIRAEMARLRDQGFHLLSEEPAVGADNKWICFIHPRDTHGVLIELCQTRTGDTWSPA